MEAKKPEKRKEDFSLGRKDLIWNAAIDAYEEYLGSEGCRERVEKILVRLVKESHRKSELTDYKLDDWDKNRIAIAKKAISEALAGKGRRE